MAKRKPKDKHTPGPWTLGGENVFGQYWSVRVAPKRVIKCEGRTDTEAAANAVLVSVAPDMLDMLRSVHKLFNMAWESHAMNEAIEQVGELIERATAEQATAKQAD